MGKETRCLPKDIMSSSFIRTETVTKNDKINCHWTQYKTECKIKKFHEFWQVTQKSHEVSKISVKKLQNAFYFSNMRDINNNIVFDGTGVRSSDGSIKCTTERKTRIRKDIKCFKFAKRKICVAPVEEILMVVQGNYTLARWTQMIYFESHFE